MVKDDLTYPRRQKQLETLIAKLGIVQVDQIQWTLVDTALTHPTIAPTSQYEQLEFVGDAVVRLAASELLLELYPQDSVGEFSAIRKVLVSDRILAELADQYGLERYLIADRSFTNDSAGRQSRLADTFEALLGALYLSTHSLVLVRPWLDHHFRQLAEEIRRDPAHLDYKSALQEYTQASHKALPEYRVSKTKALESNTQLFTAQVWLLGNQYGEGTGKSRKAAEQAAAKEALESLVKTN